MTVKKTGPKSSPTVQARITALSDSFLDCRDPGLRHAWMRQDDFHVIQMSTVGKKIAALGRNEVCGRCNTVKRERFIVTKGGIEKVGQSYDYPQGYTLPGIPRGVTPSTIVLQEAYRRAMERVANAEKGQRDRADR